MILTEKKYLTNIYLYVKNCWDDITGKWLKPMFSLSLLGEKTFYNTT